MNVESQAFAIFIISNGQYYHLLWGTFFGCYPEVSLGSKFSLKWVQTAQSFPIFYLHHFIFLYLIFFSNNFVYLLN